MSAPNVYVAVPISLIVKHFESLPDTPSFFTRRWRSGLCYLVAFGWRALVRSASAATVNRNERYTGDRGSDLFDDWPLSGGEFWRRSLLGRA